MVKVLVVRLSAIGDIFHTFSILPDIKNALPDCQIDWLVDESFVEVVKLSPLVDKIIGIPLKKWKKNKISWLLNLIKFKKNLVFKHYDYIIDTQGLIKSAVISRFLFTGKLYGLNIKSAREWPASLFYDYKYFVDQDNIAVIRLRGLIKEIFDIKQLDKLNFEITAVDTFVLGYGNYIMYLHGTSKENKKWAYNNWLNLTHWMMKNTDYNIVLTYSNDQELAFVTKLANEVNNSRLIVVDKLPFNQLAVVISNAKLIIGVDTGFTHLANLLNKPLLAIFLATNPNYVGIIENEIAHLFGGLNKTVLPTELIEYITENKLLETKNVFSS